MAGSFAEAAAIIRSVKPGAIGTMAKGFRRLATSADTAGGTLAGSAEEVGAQYGAPYAAYESRLAPVATWVRNLNQPVTSTAASLDKAKAVSEQAQWVLAQQEAALARYGVSLGGVDPAAAASAMAQAEAQALAVLNQEIAKMTAAFNAVQPPDPGTAPVQGGSGGGAGSVTDPGGPAASALATGTGGAGQSGLAAGGAGGATAGTAGTAGGAGGAGTAGATATGPQSGQFAGWVQDPTTGNLVDPATGREVDSSGRFVDPVTGQPFGDPSQYASRLEGLQGGVGALGGAGAGGVGMAPTFSGGGLGGGGGAGSFARFYGGMVPPSLVGGNPAARQLRRRAADNLAVRAETAQRYNAIASGNATAPLTGPVSGSPTGAHGYVPPMGGGMAPTGAGRRSNARGGKRMVSEPASVWGATGRGTRGKPREQAAARTEVVEDADVWTGGPTEVGPGVLGGR